MQKLDVFSTGAIVTSRLGDFDPVLDHEPQSIPADYFVYDAPLRDKSMTPRLQAKIPKMFAWQLYPNYETYLWLDGNLRLSHHNSLEYLMGALDDHDIAVLQHPDRDTVWWEYRYNWRGLHNNAPSNYLTRRYTNELLDEQMEVIKSDTNYVDNLLVNGGILMYRNTPEVQAMFKEWWYHVSRYLIMDQMSLPYVLKKSGLRVNVLPDVFRDCWWLENRRHAK